MTTTPKNSPNENSEGADVNDVLHHADDSKSQPEGDDPDRDVATGLSEG